MCQRRDWSWYTEDRSACVFPTTTLRPVSIFHETPGRLYVSSPTAAGTRVYDRGLAQVSNHEDSVPLVLDSSDADEIERLRRYTDLARPVCYGPRFVNTNR